MSVSTPTYGRFQLGKEIEWGEDATLFAATSSDTGRFSAAVVKVRRFPDSELNDRFLRAAHAQKSVANAGCKRFAPIFDSGTDDDGCAWLATRHFDGSLQDLLNARNEVHPEFLARIVDDILAGLAELYFNASRPHGNLKAGNVLLEGVDPRKARAVLTDLAAEPGDSGQADDFFAVGRIIYQLVRAAPRVPILNPPVEFTSEWQDFGEAWLTFCNKLLDRESNAASNALASLRTELRNLKTAPAGADAKKNQRGTKQVGALLLATGVIAAGVFFYVTSTKPEIKTSDLPPPLVEFLTQTSPDADEVRKLIMQGRTELPRKKDVERALREWERKEAIDKAYVYFKKLGFTGLCDALAPVRADFRIDEPLGEQIAAVRRLAEPATDAKKGVGLEWNVVERNLARLDRLELPATASKGLTPLRAWVDAEKQNIRDLKAATKRVSEIGTGLEHVLVRLKNPDLELTRLQEASFSRASGPVAPREWGTEADEFIRVHASLAADWLKRAEELRADAGALPDLDRRDLNARFETVLKRAVPPVVRDEKEINEIFAEWALKIARQPKVPVAVAPATASVPPMETPPVATPQTPPARTLDRLKELFDRTKGETEPERIRAILAAYSDLPPSLSDELKGSLDPSSSAGAAFMPVTSPKWTVRPGSQAGQTSQFVICEHTDSRQTVPFVLVSDSKPPFFIAGVETSMALAAAAAAAADVPLSTDSKAGPPGWEYVNGQIQPATHWVWNGEALRVAQNRFYPSGIKPPESPSRSTPMTWVTPAQAQAIATALGAELPSIEQWKAAYRPGNESAARLRGDAFRRQYDHWKSLVPSLGAIPPPWPDDGSYTSSGGKKVTATSAPTILPGRDENPWFASVGRGSQLQDGGIHDLIGNVAEIVRKRDGAWNFAVVGGSAISVPEDRLTEMRIGDKKPHSDVGFRLVLPAAPQEGTEAVAFRERLNSQISLLQQSQVP